MAKIGSHTARIADSNSSTRVPAGTQSGAVFRLRGKGVVNVNGMGRGDQIVRILVRIPSKLTHRQKELFEALAEELPEPTQAEENEGFFDRVRDIFG